jgi:hypothetical protein
MNIMKPRNYIYIYVLQRERISFLNPQLLPRLFFYLEKIGVVLSSARRIA